MQKRLNLLNTIENRADDLEKDSLIVNGFTEIEDEETSYVFKRPGMTTFAEGSGVAGGGFWYDSTLYYWDDTTPNNSPLIVTYT